MPRRAGYYWDRREQSYRTEAGGRTRYFRGIAKDDHEGIAAAFAEHLRELAESARPPELDVLDVCMAFVGAGRMGPGGQPIRSRTNRTHRERLARFCSFPSPDSPDVYGGRPADSMKARHLKDALRAWEAEGLSEHYRAGICRSVKAAFAWAATEDGGRMVKANPFAEVRGPMVSRAPERYATRAELAAFLRFARGRANAAPPLSRRFARQLLLLVRVAAHSGARPGELCSAWWDDFDPARGTISLPSDRHKTGGKTGKPRVIRLTSPVLIRALRREMGRPGRHPISIFVHRRGRGGVARGAAREAGEPWGRFLTWPDGSRGFEHDSTALAKAIRKLRVEAIAERERLEAEGKPTKGLELIADDGDNRFVLYRLRHTAASDHLMNKGDIYTVASLLGTSANMLETTYGHLLEDHLDKAARDLNARRRPAKG